MERKRSECNFYHLFSRGVGKQIIFEDDDDRKAFLGAIMRNLRLYDVKLFAWCLMDNHFHLLVQGDIEVIGQFMKSALCLYSKAFNKHNDRKGHLFQSRYGSEPIDGDEYFLQAIRYIHQNPAKAGLAPTSSYRWSSYGEYLGTPRITETGLALEMFGSAEEFAQFHRLESDYVLREYDDGRAAASSKQAYRIAVAVLGEHGVHAIRSLPRADRDQRLALLRQHGLTIRQIERITGISRSTIARACQKWDA